MHKGSEISDLGSPEHDPFWIRCMQDVTNPGTPRNPLNVHRKEYTVNIGFRGYQGIWGPWVPTHRGSKIHEIGVNLTPWDEISRN